MTGQRTGAAAALMAALCLTGGVAMAEGDPKAGKKVYRKCKACHTLKPGDARVGPSLHGIIGAEAGAAEGFGYSAALKEAGFVWSAEVLTEFLAGPKAYLPGTSMSFAGLKKPKDIEDLLAYIAQESEG